MNDNVMKQADMMIAATYKRHPIVIEKGSGCVLWDTSGKSYIDFMAGIAVCSLGHAHPAVIEALSRQAQQLFHVSNLFYTRPQISLAEKLVENSFADRVFFCNSGAEANEAAIKLARRYFFEQKRAHRNKIISMERSFHGRTMGALSATGQDKIRHGFDPVLEGFEFVPFNDIQALEDAMDTKTCAVIVEPIQGEGGIRCPDPDYLKNVRKLCDERGVLLIFDEIQTGMGRTGKLFAYEHFNMEPDIMTLAKALGNGLPIGAMMARESVAQAFGLGAHASTFGGTPIITAAALKVIEIILRDGLAQQAATTGEYFKRRLTQLADRHDAIIDVRGMGLLLGMKLNVPAGQIVSACMEKGFLINAVQDTILRFAPPLIIGTDHIEGLITCLDEVFGGLS